MMVLGNLFSQLLFSPSLRHPNPAALGARASTGPQPAPGLTVTVCTLGQGMMSAGNGVGSWGASPSLGAAAQSWGGGKFSGALLAWGPPAISLLGSCSQLCPRHSPQPSALGLGGISEQLHNVPELQNN